ncbi:MAG: hypothetical protein ACNA7W_14015 [Pseudomonadales bacterium]
MPMSIARYVAVILAMAIVALPAQARDRGHGYDHSHRGGHPVHRGGPPGHRGPPRVQHHHHYHPAPKRKRRSNEGAYLLGGIVIGSVLTHAVQTSRQHQPPRQYAPAPGSGYAPPVVTRRLFKDRYGDCFERHSDAGREVLIPLPDWECNW